MSSVDLRKVLRSCTHRAMACAGDDDYPYAVPLSFEFFNHKIYCHSAKAGHKINAIASNPKVCFSVVDEDTVVSKEFTTNFRSVIAFGKARIVTGSERKETFTALVEKYSGDQPE